MLKVFPIPDKAQQEALCARCAIPFEADLLAYQATVEDVFVGMCQFKLTDKGGEIYDIVELEGHRDFEAMFVMGRAALNFIDLCGVHYAYVASEGLDESLLRAIGFKKNAEGIYEVDLEGFFDEPCAHGHGMKENK